MFDQPDRDGHPEPHRERVGLAVAVRTAQSERAASMHALQVLEYALAAPAPRRLRTWLHRVIVAVDALSGALESADADTSFSILDEVALAQPQYAAAVQRLRNEQMDLCIAAAALREQIEPDPEIPIDPADVRSRLATLTQRYRQHRAREADLIYTATSIEIDEPRGSTAVTNDAGDRG